MPVTDLSCGTLRWQPLPRNCGLRTTTHVHTIRLLELATSVYVLVAIMQEAAENRCQFLHDSTDSKPHHLRI